MCKNFKQVINNEARNHIQLLKITQISDNTSKICYSMEAIQIKVTAHGLFSILGQYV